jgi:hypothetical protein
MLILLVLLINPHYLRTTGKSTSEYSTSNSNSNSATIVCKTVKVPYTETERYYDNSFNINSIYGYRNLGYNYYNYRGCDSNKYFGDFCDPYYRNENYYDSNYVYRIYDDDLYDEYNDYHYSGYRNYGIYVWNTDKYEGDFSVRFKYYDSDRDRRTKTITKSLNPGQGKLFRLSGNARRVISVKVDSRDGLRYDYNEGNRYGNYGNRYYNQPQLRERQVTKYREEVKCY